MALKPTIYKVAINLSNLDEDIYQSFALTVAQHPSENDQRMMARILAYVLNHQEFLSFTKGLSDVDVPDIWAKSLSDEFLLWIDVGEPNIERVKKACRQAQEVKIYSFNSKSDVWWKQSAKKLSELDAQIYQFNFEQVEAAATLLKRTVELSITITDRVLYISGDNGSAEVNVLALQVAE